DVIACPVLTISEENDVEFFAVAFIVRAFDVAVVLGLYPAVYRDVIFHWPQVDKFFFVEFIEMTSPIIAFWHFDNHRYTHTNTIRVSNEVRHRGSCVILLHHEYRKSLWS